MLRIYSFLEKTIKKTAFKGFVSDYFRLLEEQKVVIDAIPFTTHPMDLLAIATIALGGIQHKYLKNGSDIVEQVGFLIAQVAITVVYRYVTIHQLVWEEVQYDVSYAEKIFFQMHAGKDRNHLKKLANVFNTILILHAEHGQNCSATTVRSVASARSNIYTAVASGMAAFNGSIHGGASQLVSIMYEELLESGLDVDSYVDKKIENKNLLMGFGQRTYNRIPNCWDPRVEKMYQILIDPLFDFPEVTKHRDMAVQLIERVSKDAFFKNEISLQIPISLTAFFTPSLGCQKR